MKFKQIFNESKNLFPDLTVEGIKKHLKDIEFESKIKGYHVTVGFGTQKIMTDTGIADIPRLSINISFDIPKTNQFVFDLTNDGTLEMFSDGLNNKMKFSKFRKTKVKSFDDVIKKLNGWISDTNKQNS